MVSDSELISRLHEFLRSSDLDTTTVTIVRRQLEADFGIDLSDRKAFIREQVDLFVETEYNQPQQQEHQNDDAEEEEEEEEEKEEEEEEEEEELNPLHSQPSDSKEETEEEDKEEHKPKHSKNVKKKNKGGSNKLGDKVVKKRGGGFCKLCSLSPELQEFTGVPEMARTEVVKQLWAYIREKNLQEANNRRNIICDDRLRALFNVNSINMFQMNKALSKHIWPLDSDYVVQVKSTPTEKQKKQERDDESDESKRQEKRQKGGGKSGLLAPLQLSDALVKFLGTGESELSRSDVIKRMWAYIKGNNLQDPSDKRKIISDEKLKELFDVDSFNGFTVTKLLAPHFIKAEQ